MTDMSSVTVPLRSEVDENYTWNAPSVFATAEDWQRELTHVSSLIDGLGKYQGRLKDGPAILLEVMDLYQRILLGVGKILIYAEISHEVDTTDQSAARMVSQARSLVGKAAAAGAFINPELLDIGKETLQDWIVQEPGLEIFRHYIDDLFRKQAHIRSAEVEQLLGMLADPFSGAETTYGMLAHGELKFPPAENSQGDKLPLTSGTLNGILSDPDREARRTAWENTMDGFLAFKNTFASILGTSIKQSVFTAQARGHRNTLEASLFENNIPVEVFYNIIDVFQKNLPTWHRYWAVRRKALGVEKLHPYDVWAPLMQEKPKVNYEQAVDLVCQGLGPMGEEYVNTVRQGCLQDRWVDVYPNQGKTAGAFSFGWSGTYPFIVMSFDNTLFSLSTLAHELGHSMHSYLTWHNQPAIYSQYSLFVAEVASNFHQALVRAHLLETQTDRNFQIALIEEAMSNFHRYFFIMPTLARFELKAHQMAEKGEGLNAEILNELMAGFFAEGYGDEMHFDRQRVGITWATFGHLYSDYYVYQYATGISGAYALANRILTKEPGAVDDYLNFLRSGSSLYPLEALKVAGVDLTRPEPVEKAFETLASMVDRLESLLSE